MTDNKNHFIVSLAHYYSHTDILRFWQIILQEYQLDSLGKLTARRVNLSDDKVTLDAIIARLINLEPIDYIIGYVPFMHVDIKVNKNVLIPRSETEELVDYIIHQERQQGKGSLRILDIGAGSGCMAIALKYGLPLADITSIDVSAAALKVARENADLNKVAINFIEIDFLNKGQWDLMGGPYDIIVSNPPYIARSERDLMDASVLRHEPDMALYADGEDPFIFYRMINEFAEGHLLDHGGIYVELNALQSDQIESIFRKNYRIEILPDLQGMPRILYAQK